MGEIQHTAGMFGFHQAAAPLKRNVGKAALLGAALVCPLTPAHADPRSGDYVCLYGCRLTDANPTLQIDGDVARCTNELGGLFVGRVSPDGSIACFRKTGAFAPDGVTLRWSDGVIWKRHDAVRD